VQHFALTQQSTRPSLRIAVKATMEATVALCSPWPPSL
jgi:hypothetical protein